MQCTNVGVYGKLSTALWSGPRFSLLTLTIKTTTKSWILFKDLHSTFHSFIHSYRRRRFQNSLIPNTWIWNQTVVWGSLDRVPAWLWEVFQKQVRWGTWLGKLTHSKGGAGRRLNGQQPVHTISRHSSSSLDGQYTGWWIGKSASFSNIYCAPRKYIWARLVLNLLCSQGIYFFLFIWDISSAW